MIAFYDNKPDKFSDVGNGSILYHFNIEEIDAPTMEGETPRKQWRCDEVVVWGIISKKKIVSACINDRWDKDHEQKLINEYNSAALGIITGEEAESAVASYTSFLLERKALKESIEADCVEAGIL